MSRELRHAWLSDARCAEFAILRAAASLLLRVPSRGDEAEAVLVDAAGAVSGGQECSLAASEVAELPGCFQDVEFVAVPLLAPNITIP